MYSKEKNRANFNAFLLQIHSLVTEMQRLSQASYATAAYLFLITDSTLFKNINLAKKKIRFDEGPRGLMLNCGLDSAF